MNLLASRLETIFPHASRIHEHEDCHECTRTQAWLSGRTRAAMHSHADDASRAGSWLTDAFDWGAHRWPLYWCDLNQQRAIDCGAFASIFSYCLTIARVPHNRVQVIFPASPQERVKWDQTWCAASASTAWILDGHVYHESIIVHPDKQASVFVDTTNMVVIGARCDDPRYRPQLVRIIPDGWQPKMTEVSVAGRSLQVGTWQSWDTV